MLCHPPKRIKSPLRYPGGKGALYSYFLELMKQSGLHGGRYFEPFAGGAGLALGLLSSSVVSNVILNDADYHIYCFWISVLEENERFLEEIQNIELSVKEWQNQKSIYSDPEQYSVFEVGFSTFYLNRCNRSGILSGAGPIGGYEQKGKWQLNARFNKDDLIERITNIGLFRNHISVKNLDAIDFLKKYLPKGHDRGKIFVYVDPPYVSASDRLYLNFYSSKDHKKLSEYLLKQRDLKWVVTYDDNALIRKMYCLCQILSFNLKYSLQSKYKGNELLIAPKWLQLPDKNINSNQSKFINIIESKEG